MANKKNAQIMLDIILPKNFNMNPNTPSDVEAGALYDMWKAAPPGTEAFAVPRDFVRHINSWKAKGLVDGFSSSLSLTERGRKLIIEMVTSEPNAFDKQAQLPRYSVVKAKTKRNKHVTGKKIGKAASKDAPSFNLRKEKNASKRN